MSETTKDSTTEHAPSPYRVIAARDDQHEHAIATAHLLAERDRLHAVNAQLVAALEDIQASYDANDSRGIGEAIEASRAAIAAARGS